MKKLFSACILVTASLTATLISCSGAPDDGPYMARLKAAGTNRDSLDALRNDLRNDPEGADSLVARAARKSTDLYATAVVATKTPAEVAKYVLLNPSRQLSTKIGDVYRTTDRANFNSYTASLLEGFNAMATNDKVKFLTQVATARECGRYLEPGDKDLADALRRHYAQNADSLRAFEQGVDAQH